MSNSIGFRDASFALPMRALRSFFTRSPRVSFSQRDERSRVAFAFAVALSAMAAGCTPEIGDKCVVSTDCSTQGDRQCDTSQPGGYCTKLNCVGESCPDDAACVLFDAAIPGCGYNDRSGPLGSRMARSFCVAKCTAQSDCRDDYVCASPRTAPWNAMILDRDQGKRGCLPHPLQSVATDAGVNASVPPPTVCEPTTPAADIDASAPNIESPDGGSVDAGDAGDAGSAGDAGTADAGTDGG